MPISPFDRILSILPLHFGEPQFFMRGSKGGPRMAIRFSLRRLMAVTALVALLIYMLLLRPTAVAKRFARDMEIAAQTDFKSVSKQYFDNMRTDKSSLEGRLRPRNWSDVLGCRQIFHIRVERRTDTENQWLVSQRDFYATPIGVNDLGGPFWETRHAR